jgi:hypothetical protein
MTDEEQNADAAGSDDEKPARAVPKSAAAAAARRARRIGGPARAADAPATRGPADVAAKPAEPAEPVDLPEPAPEPAAAPAPEPVTEPVPVVETPTAAGAARTATRWRWLPAGVLIAAAVIMAVLLATFSHSVWWAKPSAAAVQNTRNELRDRVLAAAKQCVVATNKYNYQTIDADEAAGLKCTTGVQSTRYKSAMEHLIRGPANKIKASQVPQINSAGIESITANGKQWSIVVYGQLAIHNVNVKSRTDPFAAVVRMNYVHGKWLMSDVGTLAEPTS